MCDGVEDTECKCWGVIRETGGANAHVYPFNDLMLHIASNRCVCGPKWRYQPRGWMFVHASLDGREQPQLA
jgi:hypothetical protein